MKFEFINKRSDKKDNEQTDQNLNEKIEAESSGAEADGEKEKAAVFAAFGKFFSDVKKVCVGIASFYKKRTIPILICALSVLIVVLIFALLLGSSNGQTEQTKYQKWMDQLKTKDIVVCQVDTINDFFDEYYYALSEGNTTALEAMYDDPENANITTELSQIVESYSDITVYVTPGINSGEVLAFVSYDINFVNIGSAAPAVDSFYLMMDSELGSVYILTGMYTDSDINTFMYLASYREPVRSLLSSAEEGLNSALESDDELRNIYIIMNAMADDGDEEEEEETQAETESEETDEETSLDDTAAEDETE